MSKVIGEFVNRVGFADTLDGVQLQAGDLLEIKWPNGDLSLAAVKIKKGEVRDAQMGFDEFKAYIEIDINGLIVKVFLRKTELEIVRKLQELDKNLIELGLTRSLLRDKI